MTAVHLSLSRCPIEYVAANITEFTLCSPMAQGHDTWRFSCAAQLRELPSRMAVLTLSPRMVSGSERDPQAVYGRLAMEIHYYIYVPWDTLSESEKCALVACSFNVLSHQLYLHLHLIGPEQTVFYIPRQTEALAVLAAMVREQVDWTAFPHLRDDDCDDYAGQEDYLAKMEVKEEYSDGEMGLGADGPTEPPATFGMN
jgi:hypothetical protein